MADMGQLVVQLELQQAQFTKGMNDAARRMEVLSAKAKQSQAGLDQMASTFNKLAQAGKAFAAFKGLEGIAKAADQLKTLSGSFTALLGTSDKAADMMERVFAIVQRTGAPLEDVASGVQRMTIALSAMGASNQQIADVTETFLKLGKIGGASAQEAAAAFQQLGQSLAAGKLSGDELRSVLEGTPLVAQEIAKEFGVTTGQLKKLGEEGKLTADRVANALLKASADVDRRFAQLPQTLEQGMNRAAAAWTRFLAELDKVSSTGTSLQATFDFIATTLGRWADELTRSNDKFSLIKVAAEALKLAVQAVLVIFSDVAFTAETVLRTFVALGAEAAAIINLDWSKVGNALKQSELDAAAARRELDAYQKKLLQAGATAAEARAAASGGAGSQRGGGGGLTGGAAGGDSTGADKLKKENEQLKARADAITASVIPQEQYNQTLVELDKLRKLNFLSEQAYQAAKAKAVETLNAEADAVRAMIDPYFTYQREVKKLNELYMAQKIEVEELIKAQEMLKQKADEAAGKGADKMKTWQDIAGELGETLSSAMGDAFSDMITGAATAEEAFKKMAQTMLSKIAELVAEMAALWVVRSLFGGSTPGITPAPPGPLGQVSSMARLAANSNAAAFGPSTRAGATTAGGTTIAGTKRPELKVVVNNNAGAEVLTRQDESGNLEITIERVRRALSQDVRRGGNMFADTLERSYSMQRRGV